MTERGKNWTRLAASHIGIAVVLFGMVTPALADSYDDRIAAIRHGIESKRNAVNQLHGQANTLANALATINAQIDETNAQIALTQARAEHTQASIAAVWASMTEKKRQLGDNLKVMYQEAQVSTLEMGDAVAAAL